MAAVLVLAGCALSLGLVAGLGLCGLCFLGGLCLGSLALCLHLYGAGFGLVLFVGLAGLLGLRSFGLFSLGLCLGLAAFLIGLCGALALAAGGGRSAGRGVPFPAPFQHDVQAEAQPR